MKVGNIGELATQLEFAKLQYEVYTPAVDNAKYDMVVASPDGKLLKVEVKSTQCTRNGNWIVALRKTRHNKTTTTVTDFSNDVVDILAVYIVPLEEVILLEAKKITQKTTLTVCGKTLKVMSYPSEPINGRSIRQQATELVLKTSEV